MITFGKFIPMSEVLYLKNLALTKSVASIFCIVLNIKTIRLDFVSHEVLAYPMFGMISQLMFMMLLKVGSIIQKERISIIANLIWNKLFRALRCHRRGQQFESAYTYQYSKRYVIRVLSENSSLKPFFIVLNNVRRYLYYLYNRYFLPIMQLNLDQD